MIDACDFCKGRAFTKKPVTIITLNGRRATVVINYCPACGRKLRTDHVPVRIGSEYKESK